jgi:hypothetical protein
MNVHDTATTSLGVPVSRTPIRDALSKLVTDVATAGFRDYPEFSLTARDVEHNTDAQQKLVDALNAFLKVYGQESHVAGARLTETDYVDPEDGFAEDLFSAVRVLQGDLEEQEAESVSYSDLSRWHGNVSSVGGW